MHLQGVSFSNGFIGGDGRGKPNGGFGGGGSTSHGGGGGGGYSGGGGGYGLIQVVPTGAMVEVAAAHSTPEQIKIILPV